MQKRSRLRAVTDSMPGDHLCSLYHTEEEQRQLLKEFLRQGLERNEKVVYLAYASTAGSILAWLRGDGLEVESLLARGQLSIVSTESVYLRDGVFDPDRMIAFLRAETDHALAEGYSALRVTGEMAWALDRAPGSDRLIEYEAKLNGFFPGSRCVALCQYDCRRFSPTLLLKILYTHPIAVVGTTVHDNFYYIPPEDFLGEDLPAAMLRHGLRNLAERKKLEEELYQAHHELERRVEERTEELRRANRALRAQSECNQVIVRAKEEAELLQQICRIIVEDGGYRLAWVGFAEQNGSKSVRPVAHAGFEEGYVQSANVRWDDSERGAGPAGTAIRTGAPCIARNLLTDPAFGPWRAEAVARGYASAIALPLIAEGQTFGSLNIYAAETDAFDTEEVKLLRELAADLAYGLGALRTRAAHRRAEEALRASEERYRDLFENARDIIFIQDLAGNFTAVNRAAEELTGYTRDKLLKMNIPQLLAPEHVGLAEQTVQRLVAGEAAPPTEVAILAKDGRRITLEVSGRPIYQEETPVGVQGIARDVTERRRLEEQLRQAQKMEAIGQLAGGVSHDFSNLLGVILGYSDLLLDGVGPDDPARKKLEEIKKAGQRAVALTRQLLAFSRKQLLELRVLDLNSVVADTAKLLGRLIGEDIELLLHLDPGLGRLKADPVQIEQIVMNLAVNARDAMPQGGRLSIETANAELDESYCRLHAGARPGAYVTLALSDTGCGMDAATQSRIFEPFFTTKPKGHGTGLGLATVYGTVKQSGGNIFVYSEPGQGTTFKIYLPRVSEPAESLPAAKPPGRAARGSETILLVEDEAPLRQLVRQILSDQGYTVLEAANGEEALRISEAHRGPIHLMMTDVIMPGISGQELARRLASLHPEIKVFFVSGYTDDSLVDRGVLEAGMSFLAKPFSRDALTQKLREVLDQRVA